MAVVHQLCEAGGEGYLPWALARERQLRLSGVEVGARRYDVDGVQIEIILRGDVSHVFVRGVSSSDGWVAFMATCGLRFTQANAVPTQSYPTTTPRPTPPVKPPAPPVPVFTSSTPLSPLQGPDEQLGEPPDGYAPYGSWMLSDEAAFLATKDAIISEQDARWTAAGRNSPGYPAGGQHDGSVYHVDHALLKLWRTYDKNTDFYYLWKEEVIVWSAAMMAWGEAVDAIDAAYAVTLAEWVSTVLTPWELANSPYYVCPAFYADLVDLQRAGRAPQIAALKAEQDMGMLALPVFNAVSRPAYLPQEQPELPLIEYIDGTLGTQTVWGETGSVLSPASAALTTAAPAVHHCVASVPAAQLGNVYAGAAYAQYPSAIRDAIPGPENLTHFSLDRAYGYMADGVVRGEEVGPPAAASVTAISQYADWYGSARVSPGVRAVDFDLLQTTGTVYVAVFEFYAYDYKTEQWLWAPSLPLLDTEPLKLCGDLCVGVPDSERDVTFASRPEVDVSVTSMRSRKLFKQRRYLRTEDGVYVWSEPEEIPATALEVDLAPLLGFVGARGLSEIVCAVQGLEDWMQPAAPNVSTAVNGTFMSGTSVPSDISDVASPEDFKAWLYRQCLVRFGLIT